MNKPQLEQELTTKVQQALETTTLSDILDNNLIDIPEDISKDYYLLLDMHSATVSLLKKDDNE